ncbi:phosphoglycerate dehydrogenase [Helicobacter sp. MIT 21-1697]|uniref:phosphoglycerate dehydrogenase n=1 Tax=Helicobacter sp. MIT 21-1697 TaxID=2993733 RepID=UPI00224B6B81|nr:phosphoglycerate dehydrogenase [Helicobacter sp. MIT 21-1697]MCX2717568.1 phosphoglycerate dehydrogenase [Helicobacter sp. MIT 21-1697]
MKYKIIVCDHIHQKGLDLLMAQNDVQMENLASLPKNELLTKIKEADVVITRSSTDVDETFLASSGQIRAVVRAGVGVDNVDIEGCSRKGIVVMNVPTANTIAAVELTMAHLINAVRNFPGANTQLKHERKWKREDWYGIELKGKKLGIIGFGNIGSRVGIRAKAFEMEVLAYDPYILPSKATDLGVAYTSNFEEILSCDIITIHTPKNAETKNMITAKQIAQMKDGVILINCARGGLYNEKDLYDALSVGKIKWAGIDVFDKEPAINNALLDLPNVYVTPHIGANTLESQEQIALQAAQAAIEAARGSSYPNALNLPVKESELPSMVKPYLELIQKLAFLAVQANKGVITSIHIQAQGEISAYGDSLQTFALVGALNASLGDKINYVNAPFIAKERGIDVKMTLQQESETYKNHIYITLSTQNESITLSGAVFEDRHLRLTSINHFQFDIEPKGKMIFFKNTDVPGVIGLVGSILGNHQVNIADFRLARQNKEAMAVILVDSEVSSEVIKQLEDIPACLGVKIVNL